MPRTARETHIVIRAIRGIVSGVFVVVAIGWIISVLGVIGFAAFDGAKLVAATSAEKSVGTKPVDAIVVLGAAQYDGKPSPVLRARLDHAIALWRDSTAQLLIFTGGKGAGDTTTEAAVGGVYARRQGVPDNVILLESEGRTTSASMRSVASMLQARDKASIVLVSDPFHMFRLWVLARRMGIEAYTSPTRTSPISTGSIRNAGYILSESFKVPIALILG